MAAAFDLELTNCPSLRLPSSLSLDRRRHVPTWQSNEEDGLQQRRCRRQGRHDHDHSVYENESLWTMVSVSIPNEIRTVKQGLENPKGSGCQRVQDGREVQGWHGYGCE